MGLDAVEAKDEGGGGVKESAIPCSICLEVVTDNGVRSWAKLHCGHQFHLDCIGSAFNAKGQMQCPNCRKVERGQWLFASGCRPSPEVSMDDWQLDEDIYDLNFNEMSFGVHWCPFGGLTRLPSSFDEGDFPSSAYHDLHQHTIFAEQTALSSAAHPCPYVAYVGIHPPSSNSSDGPNFNNHWNGSSVPNEMQPPFVLQGMDAHYHGWEHHSSSFPTTSSRLGNMDQSSSISANQRVARTNSDSPGSVSLGRPFLVSHTSAGSSVAPSMIPPYPGSVARSRNRVQALQAYFQQPSNSVAIRAPVITNTRRSSSHRGLSQVGPVASSSDQAGGFFFHPSGTSGGTFQEAENSVINRFHAWERERLPAFPPTQVDSDSIWGPFLRPAGTSFRQRRGSERMPSQNWS